MPVEVLAAVLVLSVLANAALLLSLARADHVTFRWPGGSGDAGTQEWPDPHSREMPSARRRSLFVAGQSETAPIVQSGIPISTATPVSTGGMPAGGPGSTGAAASVSLPPDLADLLARPAPLGPPIESGGYGGPTAGGNRFRAAAPDGTLVRMQRGSGPAMAQGITLDALTGLEDQGSWNRVVEVENARLLRYRRPSTVIVAELDGLRKLSERLGDEPVARLLPVVAEAFRSEARTSDWVAHIGYGRFGVFLAETDEIAAINYVERIRQICEPWLSSAAVPLRLAIGWSSPTASSDLEFAIKLAEERMHADRHGSPKLPAPRAMAPKVVSLTDGQDTPGAFDAASVSPAEPGSLQRGDPQRP